MPLPPTIDGQFPRAVGIAAAGEALRDTPPLPVTACSAGLLGDLAAEWCFFNHGGLYRDGRLDADPLAELAAPLRVFRLPRLVVTGVGPVFGHALLATPRQAWPRVREHLATVALLTPDFSCYRESRAIPITLVDPLAWRQATPPDPLPRLAVTIFGFVGSDYSLDFVTPDDPRQPVLATRRDPCAACRAILAAYRVGRLDPLAAGDLVAK